MLNKPMLQSVMALRRDTQTTLAHELGISVSRLNAKINETGGAAFTLHEMQAIKERYHLGAEAVCRIFCAGTILIGYFYHTIYIIRILMLTNVPLDTSKQHLRVLFFVSVLPEIESVFTKILRHGRRGAS